MRSQPVGKGARDAGRRRVRGQVLWRALWLAALVSSSCGHAGGAGPATSAGTDAGTGAPGLGEGTGEDASRSPAGLSARLTSREVAMGLGEALFGWEGEQGWREDAAREGLVGVGLGRLRWFVLVPLSFMVAAFGVLAALLLKERHRARRSHHELRRREESLHALLEAVKATEPHPWSEDLRRALSRRLRGERRAEFLRDYLAHHPSLRLRAPTDSPSHPGDGPAQVPLQGH